LQEAYDFKRFGWQGFIFKIPRNCRFIAESGSINSGFMRFDAGKLYFEIKWEPLTGKVETPLKIAENFVQKLKKKMKLKALKYKKGLLHVNGHNAVFIYFTTDLANKFIIWSCKESKRVIIIQFTFPIQEKLEKIISPILKSLKCHGFKVNCWSILGFTLKTPKSFQLKRRRILVGRTTLTFLEEKKTLLRQQETEIIFECFSLANIRFKETYANPRKWIETYYINELKGSFRRIKFEEFSSHSFRDHRMAICIGKACSGITLRRNTFFITGAWYCSKSSRMFVLTLSSTVKKLPFTRGINVESLKRIFRKVLSTVICH